MTGREDDHTTTVDAAAAHARRLYDAKPHPSGCGCRPCWQERAADEADPWP